MSLPRSVFLHVVFRLGQACRRGRGVFPVPAAAHPLRVIGPVLFATLTLAGCDPEIREDANLGISDGQRLTQDQRDLLRAQLDGRVYREDKPFYGSAVEVKRGKVSGKPLPKSVEGARGISLRLSGQSDVKTIAAAITQVSDIPVNIRTRYIVGGGDVIEVPIGTKMRVDYEGALSAFLDRLAARMDVAWAYDGTVITIDRMTRRTWRVPLPIGETKITENSTITGTAVARGEESGGDAGSNSNLEITNTRTLDQWQDLEDRLAPLAPSPASITLSPTTGRVEVFGPPSVQKAVGAVLEDVVATANTRIGLDIAVYFVDTDRADEFGVGIDLQSPREGRFGARKTAGAIEKYVASLYGTTGGFLILEKGDDNIDFTALARDNAVVDYRLASAVAQSGVITPIAITDRENYVESKTVELAAAETVTPPAVPPPVNPPAVPPPASPPATNQAASQRTSYNVETLQTGLSIAALPRLIDDRQIQLSLTFNYSDGVVANLVSDIQTPKTNNREIRNQTVLAPGETLVLSGYEQDIAERRDGGFGVFRRIGLGGESKAQRKKVRMIIMVRPTLIPARSPRQGGRS